ncbi:hypothetical protein AVEN_136957-1 [Araneus ventricosus]|uniref:Uncharacterized protein n=1 Tax=Araneus ventricosus TaxID=182803 RepID=A0A4Y2BGU7_ARAVE|nr:hypothetical protein AVEN_136957-1 [Araneus ventricosus]
MTSDEAPLPSNFHTIPAGRRSHTMDVHYTQGGSLLGTVSTLHFWHQIIVALKTTIQRNNVINRSSLNETIFSNIGQPENWITPALPWHPGPLNGSHCNISSTEAGVLAAITGHFQTPSGGRIQAPNTIHAREARTRLLFRRLLIRVLAVSPGGIQT